MLATGHDHEAVPMPVTERDPKAIPMAAQIGDVRAELLSPKSSLSLVRALLRRIPTDEERMIAQHTLALIRP